MKKLLILLFAVFQFVGSMFAGTTTKTDEILKDVDIEIVDRNESFDSTEGTESIIIE